MCCILLDTVNTNLLDPLEFGSFDYINRWCWFLITPFNWKSKDLAKWNLIEKYRKQVKNIFENTCNKTFNSQKKKMLQLDEKYKLYDNMYICVWEISEFGPHLASIPKIKKNHKDEHLATPPPPHLIKSIKIGWKIRKFKFWNFRWLSRACNLLTWYSIWQKFPADSFFFAIWNFC